MLFSVSMLSPIIVNFIYHDGSILPFFQAFILTLSTGFIFYFSCKNYRNELKIRDGFVIVVLFWVVLCSFSSIPLILSPAPNISITDAIFESVSGITATGATIITNIEALPHNILFYRQQMQFLGGMGIILLAVAVLPMLGIGGMQLYNAELPGPLKETKLTPRIAETAKALWLIYVAITALCALCYWLFGMTAFDAIGESFSTVSTGGFSIHSDSFAYYKSDSIELIACIFMYLGGVNFSLHFIAFRYRSLKHYWQDEEFRAYTFLLIISSLVVAFGLMLHAYFFNTKDTFIKSFFNVISLATTTGFTSTSFNEWPKFIPILIMLLAIIGACGASTGGGVKVIRALLLYKQTRREVVRLVHPNVIFNIKFGKQSLSRHIMQALWGFVAVFMFLYLILLLLLMAFGLDLTSSVGATTASLANAGAGIGSVSQNFQELHFGAKWVLIFAMLAGRLEIFSLIVIFTPSFWRK